MKFRRAVVPPGPDLPRQARNESLQRCCVIILIHRTQQFLQCGPLLGKPFAGRQLACHDGHGIGDHQGLVAFALRQRAEQVLDQHGPGLA
jgi:hypothetical protein